jgi:hypothetical protein
MEARFQLPAPMDFLAARTSAPKNLRIFCSSNFSPHLHYADSQLTLLMTISVYTSNEIVFASSADDDIFNPWLGAWL